MTDFDARGGCVLSSLGSSECHRERPGDSSEGPGLPGPDDKGPGCHVLPQRSWATNPKYLFLREIGGGSCLKAFLDIVIMGEEEGPHWGGTLVLDELVTLTAPLRIPPNFTLAGVGMFGSGGLRVPNDLSGPAISFEPGGNAVLRDFNIETAAVSAPSAPELRSRPVGISIEGPGPIYIDGVRVFGLSVGIQGERAIAVQLSNCSLDGNFVNIKLQDQCRHWRIRDCDIRFGWTLGVILRSSVDVLIHGCQFEKNGFTIGFSFELRGAILMSHGECFGTFIFGNRFEGNGFGPVVASCLLDSNSSAPEPGGSATRFLCNLLAQDQPRPGEFNDPINPSPQPGDNLQTVPGLTHTHIGFNTSNDWGFLLQRFPLSRINESM